MARYHQWDQLVCPECQNELDIQQDDVRDGEIVSCTDCGSQFEVMTRPFDLRRVEDHGAGSGTITHRPAA